MLSDIMTVCARSCCKTLSLCETDKLQLSRLVLHPSNLTGSVEKQSIKHGLLITGFMILLGWKDSLQAFCNCCLSDLGLTGSVSAALRKSSLGLRRPHHTSCSVSEVQRARIKSSTMNKFNNVTAFMAFQAYYFLF